MIATVATTPTVTKRRESNLKGNSSNRRGGSCSQTVMLELVGCVVPRRSARLSRDEFVIGLSNVSCAKFVPRILDTD